ncbi:aminoglycoside adenylyltransferase domain-containing protein [Nonomuraea sp. SYSU D8015]|uniref:aminoglycoside adenylyltransferase domain-containing protein n=1 Tax=Nonomuraea sp. SYSU D8015 TaxID=2593644 RepID=UPI0016615C94|nr:aminoglycoside adenylyltransferase domain-containing protein [Nonomuraea sp. SYSU D8015]
MLPDEVARAVSRYLAVADRLLPGRVRGFYVVGSTALGAWQAGRSDIDFVAAVDGDLGERDMRRLALLHKLGNVPAAWQALVRARPAIPGTLNGVFVATGDLSKPVTRIRPLASHSGPSFKRGRGFEVNPVVWKILLEKGVTVRGPAPHELGLDPEPDQLREWNLQQLHGHWATWAGRALSDEPPRKPLLPAHRVAMSAVLSPPRLHHTIVTGEVISKEAAAAYALDTFEARWRPLIRLALARRLGRPAPPGLDASVTDPRRLPRVVGEFILDVIASADRRHGRGVD